MDTNYRKASGSLGALQLLRQTNLVKGLITHQYMSLPIVCSRCLQSVKRTHDRGSLTQPVNIVVIMPEMVRKQRAKFKVG